MIMIFFIYLSLTVYSKVRDGQVCYHRKNTLTWYRRMLALITWILAKNSGQMYESTGSDYILLT